MATPEEILMVGLEQAGRPLQTLMQGRLQLARENAARQLMLEDEGRRRQERLEDEKRQRGYRKEDVDEARRYEESIYKRTRQDRREDVLDLRKYEDEQRAKIFKEQMDQADKLEEKQVRRELDALRVPYDPAAPMATLRGMLAQEKSKVKLDEAMKVARADAAIRLEGQGFERQKDETDAAYLGRFGSVKTESDWRAYDAQVSAANQAEQDAREALKDALSIGQNRNVEQQALQEAAALSGISIKPGETAAQVAERIADSYFLRQGAAQQRAQQFLLAYNESVTTKSALSKEELDFRRQSVGAALQSLRSAGALKQELAKRRPVLPRPSNMMLPEDSAATPAPSAQATPVTPGTPQPQDLFTLPEPPAPAPRAQVSPRPALTVPQYAFEYPSAGAPVLVTPTGRISKPYQGPASFMLPEDEQAFAESVGVTRSQPRLPGYGAAGSGRPGVAYPDVFVVPETLPIAPAQWPPRPDPVQVQRNANALLGLPPDMAPQY